MNLRRVPDARVQQFWDQGRLLSKAMGEKDRQSIVWDTVKVYSTDATWKEDTPPTPVFGDGPVVKVVPRFSAALKQAIGPSD